MKKLFLKFKYRNAPRYWTFEIDDDIRDLDCPSSILAQSLADMWWEQHVIDMHDDLRNGDVIDEEIFLIKFYYDDNGERVIEERNPSTVEYEHYHGDHAEHFRQSDYI